MGASTELACGPLVAGRVRAQFAETQNGRALEPYTAVATSTAVTGLEPP